MPPKEQKQHERLGSLGSMGSREGNKVSMAARFRPKNFAKPAQVKTEEAPDPSSTGAVAVKQEPVSPRAQHRKSPQSRTHRRHREVTQDTVTFGGGIGVASKGPRRTTTRGNDDARPPIQKGTPGSTQKRGVNMDVPVKKEDIPDMHTSSSRSTSSDSDEEMDEGLYRPTIVQPPADMPRDVGDIDTAEHAEASERISSLFTDASDGNLMLFQLPEKLPIIKEKNNKVLMNEMTQCCSLRDVPNKVIGKLLITRSGSVKMKIGDIIFDVNKGMECRGRQELAFVDKNQNNLVMLGPVGDRITVSPDMDSLLDGMGSSDTE
mmetsp:Transcript_13566/g.27088  ORF Transcript_13566/g.27088 Transcript_13566/m.27088 type:complete len:320 (+) Transcript_13566:485-1444(+)